MDFGIKDIVQSISLLGSIVGLVWYLRGTIATLHAQITKIESQLDEIDRIQEQIKESRQGRASIHTKIDDMQGRIIRLETKMKMTRSQ